LTAIPSINVATVKMLLAEVAPDLRRFRSPGAFANWLGLCPNNNITGGKVLSSKTRKVVSRLAAALRMAAESLCRDNSYLELVRCFPRPSGAQARRS
jgi:transposase